MRWNFLILFGSHMLVCFFAFWLAKLTESPRNQGNRIRVGIYTFVHDVASLWQFITIPMICTIFCLLYITTVAIRKSVWTGEVL